MARPALLNATYYTHNADLRNDRRVKAIRTQLGVAGYGLLHMLLEALTHADYTELNVDEDELELLAGDFGVSATEIRNLLQIGEKVKLFAYTEAGLLICPELNKWLEPVFLKRKRAKAGVSATDTRVSVAETTQSKEEKKKELLNSNSERKLPPAPGVGDDKKKIGGADFSSDLNAQALAPSSPVARPPSFPFGRDPEAFPAQLKWPFESEEFRAAWVKWRRHLADLDKPFRGDTHEEGSLILLTRLAGTDEALALKIIHESIGNGWKTLINHTQSNGSSNRRNNGQPAAASRVGSLSASDYTGGRSRSTAA